MKFTLLGKLIDTVNDNFFLRKSIIINKYYNKSEDLQHFSILLYSSSYNKSSLAFKVEAIMLHLLKPTFCQFSDMLIAVLDFQGEELFHRSFHFLLIVRCRK